MHKAEEGTGNSQHGFINGRLCLTNLISFCDKMNKFVVYKREVNVIKFDFSKVLNTVSCNILVTNIITLCTSGQSSKEVVRL